jgi:replicative DNA helicase
MLSDLRESGSLEEDADKVIFIYREEKYAHLKSTKKGLAEIIVAKNKNGQTGFNYVQWQEEIMKFRNLAPDYKIPEDIRTGY